MAKIKINVRADEDKDILYYRQFTIVTSLPNAGDEYAGRKVVSVGRVGKDPEQPETRCDDYDCYRLVFSPAPEEGGSEGESDTEYVAISNTEPNHRETLVRIDSVLPSATEANIIIEHYLKRSPSLLEEIDSLGIDHSAIVQDYFGFSDDAFEKLMLTGSLIRVGTPYEKGDPEAPCPGSTLITGPFSFEFRGMVPYWWTADNLLEISTDDVDALSSEGLLPKRTVSDLHPDVFARIIEDCEELGEDWMAEEGYPSWFSLISLDAQELSDICRLITDICFCPFREIPKKAGISQAEFCRKLFISRRTVEDWSSGRNKCRIYLRLLFAEKLGLLKRR